MTRIEGTKNVHLHRHLHGLGGVTLHHLLVPTFFSLGG